MSLSISSSFADDVPVRNTSNTSARTYVRHSSDEERRLARIESSRKFRDKQRQKALEVANLERQMAELSQICEQQATKIAELMKQLEKQP